MRLIWEWLLKSVAALLGAILLLSLIGATIMNIFKRKDEDE